MYTMLRIGTDQGDLTLLYTKKANKYVDCIKYIEETKKNLNLNCNYDMCIDKLIFEIFRKTGGEDIDEILIRLIKFKRKTAKEFYPLMK